MKNKKLIILAVNLLVIGGAICWGYLKFEDYFNNPWTRDGQVRATVIQIAPRVSGPIVNIEIKDNQFVHKGDLLFQIDKSTYEVALTQAQISLKQAKLNAESKKIEYDRLIDIQRKDAGAVSHKDLIRRKVAYEQALLSIEASKKQLESAQLNLEFTDIYASVDGYVSNVDIQKGTQAVANQPLLALVDSNSFWVFGYFRENQLQNVTIGDNAKITLMAYPDLTLDAEVESISWGIAPTDGTVGYNLLPNVNPVFQWIRLAKRIPVRFKLATLPEKVELRFGLSASVMVMAEKTHADNKGAE